MAKLKVYPMYRLAEAGGGGIHLKHTPFGEIGAPVDFSHRDDYYLFSLICDGCGTASVDFTEITLNKNDGIIILPGQVHHGNAQGKCLYYECCSYHRNILQPRTNRSWRNTR